MTARAILHDPLEQLAAELSPRRPGRTGCVVYAADSKSPLDFLPYRDGKPLPGGLKLGINPGPVKWEGTQSVLWGEGIREQFEAPELNLARYIKDGTVTDQDTGE